MEENTLVLPFQNYPSLTQPIRRYGCRFMCLSAIAMIEVGKALTYPQVEDLYGKACLLPDVVVNPNTALCGAREDWIINEAFKMLGHPEKRGIQVGQIDREGQPKLWNGNKTDDYKYVIVHWKTHGPDGHFTLVDREETAYDPHSDQYDGGYTIDKVSISRELIYKIY